MRRSTIEWNESNLFCLLIACAGHSRPFGSPLPFRTMSCLQNCSAQLGFFALDKHCVQKKNNRLFNAWQINAVHTICIAAVHMSAVSMRHLLHFMRNCFVFMGHCRWASSSTPLLTARHYRPLHFDFFLLTYHFVAAATAPIGGFLVFRYQLGRRRCTSLDLSMRRLRNWAVTNNRERGNRSDHHLGWAGWHCCIDTVYGIIVVHAPKSYFCHVFVACFTYYTRRCWRSDNQSASIWAEMSCLTKR